MESEPVLSGAVIACGIPAVDRPEINVIENIKTGDYVKVDADAGIITVAARNNEPIRAHIKRHQLGDRGCS